MSLNEKSPSASGIGSGCARVPEGEKAASAALVLAGCSAISGAIVGFLLAGNIYVSAFLLISVLLAGWVGWWARGLYDES
ncbi:hypothetical protein [Rhizobium sp. GR12]|uniref:hypothetical protein n=1 Tax=Rhizobium sp. GR12 TaxID=3053925 RepID=UPI002FBE8A84